MLRLLLNVGSHRTFLTLLPYVEKVLAETGEYKNPFEYTIDEIQSLVNQAKEFCSHDVEIQLKKHTIEVSYHVYKGPKGNRHETVAYTPFGLEQYIAWERRRQTVN